jgi:aminoglycoside phosphotransferase (APT) family kinase protein
VIDRALLEALLHARLPGFEALVSCERLSAGASRETYRLVAHIGGEERKLALRRAADDASAMGEGPGLTAEAQLFSAAREAGVPGPEVLVVLAPEDGLGAGFVMAWVEGETLGGRIARGGAFADVRPKLARQCGEILARLHGVQTNRLGSLSRMSPRDVVEHTRATYLAMNTAQPMIDFTAKWLRDNLPAEREAALVHGDFRNGNLMVDPHRGIVAVLDWELAHAGDPMRDLGWLLTRSWRFGGEGEVGGFGAREEMYAGYEEAGGRLDRGAVRFWEVFGSFWWAVGCLSMAQSFREGSETSVERPVIGRRSSECQIDCVNMLIPGPFAAPVRSVRTLSATSLPRSDEVLRGVRDFLDQDAAKEMGGRGRFLARVAANAVDIVLRELEMGAAAEARESEALGVLLKAQGDAAHLRAQLCKAIRDNAIDLRSEALRQYLRDSVLAQVMIDQPDYPGAREAQQHAKA